MAKVKVKVCVVVDRKGQWASAGWSVGKAPPSEGDVISSAVDMVEEGERRYWLTAELEMPEDAEPIQVSAEVSEIK